MLNVEWLSWAQGVGYLASLCTILSLVPKKHSTVLMLGIVATSVWALHFHLLDFPVIVAFQLLSAVRMFIGLHAHKLTQRWKYVAVIGMMTSTLCIAAIDFSWPIMLPAVATLYASWITLMLPPRLYRPALLVLDTLWIISNSILGSIGGLLTSVICFSLNLRAWWWWHTHHKEEQLAEDLKLHATK